VPETISSHDLNTAMRGTAEIALLDVREIVAYGTGHLFAAASMPASRLELEVERSIPRKTTPIVVTDADGSISARAAMVLAAHGYTSVCVHEGGAQAWSAAGLSLFPELDVPSKGFGAFARRYGQPDFIDPAQLQSELADGNNILVLDARPRSEYHAGNIPGSIAAPAGDLVRCFDDLVSTRDTRVVVNCMSATRGILGALSLVAAGVPNPIQVLHHGTRGWLLAGFDLERGAERVAHPPSEPALRAAVARASRLLQAANVAVIDSATLRTWRADASRSTYSIDVRTAEEFATAHICGARSAAESEIVMSPLHYVPTLRARVVLTDDDTVRASVAALWLAQMGLWEVAVLRNGLVDMALISGDEDCIVQSPPTATAMTVTRLRQLQRQGAARIVDVGTSDEYARAHIPGARWCSRAEISAYLSNATFASTTVLTSSDGAMASLAGHDCGDAAYVLVGGNIAWQHAGNELTTQTSEFVTARVDHWLASSERAGDQRRNVMSYLAWENLLLDDINAGSWTPYTNLIWGAQA
jgi:rhodanese-related sulfurtransferase